MKTKYKSAEHKRKELEAQKIQDEMYKKWGIKDHKLKSSNKEFKMNTSYRGSETQISSVQFTAKGCTKKQKNTYTGDLIKGIACTHKSNLIPITSSDQAIEVARMRRG